MSRPSTKPQGNSLMNEEMQKAENQFQQFDNQVKSLTLDAMNMAPVKETESTVTMTQREIATSKDVYLKPRRSIASREKFNEDYREQYNFQKQYVRIIAQNKEIIGEAIEMWTKPFAGMPAEEWVVPVGKPIWTPRYVAEQIKRARYHSLRMEDKPIGNSSEGTYYGSMVVDNVINRLDANKAETSYNVFMGESNF